VFQTARGARISRGSENRFLARTRGTSTRGKGTGSKNTRNTSYIDKIREFGVRINNHLKRSRHYVFPPLLPCQECCSHASFICTSYCWSNSSFPFELRFNNALILNLLPFLLPFSSFSVTNLRFFSGYFLSGCFFAYLDATATLSEARRMNICSLTIGVLHWNTYSGSVS
jgi:hypothetical protein